MSACHVQSLSNADGTSIRAGVPPVPQYIRVNQVCRRNTPARISTTRGDVPALPSASS